MKYDTGILIGRRERRDEFEEIAAMFPKPTYGNLGERVVRIPPPVQPVKR